MALDDLRAALGDLAAQVDGAHEDALPAVQDRGRHRRRRRNGIITGATTTALVVVVAAGIALAGHHQTPHDIATGPRPSTPPATAPPTTSGVCTQADLSAGPSVPMPAPTRITATRGYRLVFARLDPPPAGVQPRVPAAQIWAASHGNTYRAARYELVLTSYSAFVPSKGGVPEFWHRLMWVVIGSHVPFSPEISRPFGGGTTVPPPECYFGHQLFLFDANTGQQLEQMTFG